jgi:RNA 3'-terminal phosphate cyclase (ATP)
VDFRPGPINLPGHYSANPGTAGSTTLLLQVSLPCLLFSSLSIPSTLTLHGGTNAIQAPQIDYTQYVFFPFLRRYFGLDLLLDIRRRGYYPKGGGIVFCSVSPTAGPLPAVTLTHRGAVTSIEGHAYVGNLPARMATAMSEAAKAKLVAAGVCPDVIDITILRETGDRVVGYGSGIVLWAKTEGGCILGGSAIGKKGLDAAGVGEAASTELLRNLDHGGCVDEYLQVRVTSGIPLIPSHVLFPLQDQIVLFLALAEGESVIKTGPLTLHTRLTINVMSVPISVDIMFSGLPYGWPKL